MVIDDLDILGAGSGPDKTHAPLPVHANAVLALSVALQGFEVIVRGNSQIFQIRCAIEHRQLPHGNHFDIHETTTSISLEQVASVLALERLDRHVDDSIAKR